MDFLANKTGLSKSVIKDCLNKGAVWIKRHGKKEQRIRRAKYILRVNDRISFYFDSEILRKSAPAPTCLAQEKDYSVWIKPAGLLSQGTRFGDHCSLLRYVEKTLSKQGIIPHLLHRLDREAQGLVMLAHNKRTAAALSELFLKGSIKKQYSALVKGLLAEVGKTVIFDSPLDSKKATTEVTVVAYDSGLNWSKLDINLLSGRYHQIRRHLQTAGHPIIGDNRYGIPGDKEELQLEAYMLSFLCPRTKKKKCYRLEKTNILI